MAALYLNHPYGRPVIGWRSEIEKLNREDALAFYKRFYAPNNATLIVAGDVTVQDIPRVLEPQLPPEWAKQIKATKPGAATEVRETEAGIEFIGICSAREVSDDQAARMVLSAEGDLDEKGKEMSEKYLAELPHWR